MSDSSDDKPIFQVIEGEGRRSRKKFKLPPPGAAPKAWIVTIVDDGEAMPIVFRDELKAQCLYSKFKEYGLRPYLTSGVFNIIDATKTREELIVAILELGGNDVQKYLTMELEQLIAIYNKRS
jgi:hypothetical protein